MKRIDIRRGKGFSITNNWGSIDLVVNNIRATHSIIYAGFEVGPSRTPLIIHSGLEPTVIMQGVSIRVPLVHYMRINTFGIDTVRSNRAYLYFFYDGPTRIYASKMNVGESIDLGVKEETLRELEMPIPEGPLNLWEGPTAFMYFYQQFQQD